MSRRNKPDDNAVTIGAQSPLDETVRDAFGLACPNCNSDARIDIEVACWARLTPDGTDVPDDGHYWEPSSDCRCMGCDHRATVADFMIER